MTSKANEALRSDIDRKNTEYIVLGKLSVRQLQFVSTNQENEMMNGRAIEQSRRTSD